MRPSLHSLCTSASSQTTPPIWKPDFQLDVKYSAWNTNNSLFPLLQASSISKGLTCKLFTLKASERIVRGMIAPLGMELAGSLRKVDSCKAVAQLKAKLGVVARHTICRERIEVDINLCRQPPVLVETKCLGSEHVHRFDYSCNKVFATTMVQEGECRTDHYFRTHTAFQRLEIGCQAKRV